MKKESLQETEQRVDNWNAESVLLIPSELPQTTETVLTKNEPYPLDLLHERMQSYNEKMDEQRRKWDAEKEENRRSFPAHRQSYFAPTITTASADSLEESVAEVDPTE